MPISPFKPIELLQNEYHNRVSPRDKEDRLHAELRGETLEFTVEEGEQPKDLSLVIDNIGLDTNESVNLGLRLDGFECETNLEEFDADLNFLYVYAFLKGEGSASEFANPLMADLKVAGYSPYDVRMSLWVSTTYQSGIWDAIHRVAVVVSHYHHEWFNCLQELSEEYANQYSEEQNDIPMQAGVEIAEHLNSYNYVQGYGLLLDYINYKRDEEEEVDRFEIPEEIGA